MCCGYGDKTTKLPNKNMTDDEKQKQWLEERQKKAEQFIEEAYYQEYCEFVCRAETDDW